MSVRLSEQEAEILDRARGGTPRAAYLRSLIPAGRVPLPSQLAPVVPDPVATAAGTLDTPSLVGVLAPDQVEVSVTDTSPPLHRHRRGAVISTGRHKGQTINTYRCAVDGCDHEMKD